MNETKSKPAYLIASSMFAKGHGSLGPYSDAAHPIFEGIDVEILTVAHPKQGFVAEGFGMPFSTIRQLEGNWPDDASFTIFKFASMEALMSFWNSPEYQKIKHLRTDAIPPHFTFAVEGL